MFAAFLHDLTGEQLIARRTRGTADKWEHDDIDCARFTIPDVIGYLLRPDRRNHWTPTHLPCSTSPSSADTDAPRSRRPPPPS